MKVITNETVIPTEGNCHIVDITQLVRDSLKKTKLDQGNCTVFSIGSTASITTIEFESGLLQDFPKIMDKIVPQFANYKHNDTWGDRNGHSHIRSAILGTSLCIPFKDSELMLGTWQQIVLVDFDEKPRSRRVVIQFMGE